MNIIITAGGTSEQIDNVRKITNSSTGALGIEIYNQLKGNLNIQKIYYITSSHCLKPNLNYKSELIIANSAETVLSNIEELLTKEKIDVVIHSMAVSDYKTKNIIDMEKVSKFLSTNIIENNYNVAEIETLIMNTLLNKDFSIDRTNKVSSSKDNMFISLEKNPKIINRIKEISPETMLIGFKLLSNSSKEELVEAAKKVITNSKADYVIANDLSDIKNGEHKAIVVSKNNKKYFKEEEINGISYPKLESKLEIAEYIDNLVLVQK